MTDTSVRKGTGRAFTRGTIVVFVFWVLTPMQGAVFGTAPVLSSPKVNMVYPIALMDPASQATALSQAFVNRGYAITWLNQDLPAVTTPHAPTNWTADTVKY
ncbi:hypothetical protein BM221_010303 [Beauveria bassiana]|uniref:Uncharacterized protein n=1 Tax=Beauveria bassiana TaxID=176275 RepID=A0A2N6N973_BEABA|nr:hypothetical protein BM221_010303 [Beauveria bassiana]